MNFFAHQDRAKSTTKKLVFLFVCAIVSLIIITSLLIIFALGLTQGSSGQIELSSEFVTSDIFILVSLGVIALVACGSLFRLAQLKGGGKVVAESMGGRLLNMHTRDADERKILNVVEEMAIASGIPVPPVYLMEDSAINAFAAGYQSQDAVIGITRGCIQQLDRDELQGVVAHEFSHIFNGDMRLNIRLIGLLYGIMVIGLIGYFILRGSVYRSHSYRSNKKGGGIAVLGIGLVIVGYGGTFFGNIIKAAVSRQREFLADASAVQFTRNPEGIAGALKKIGGFKDSSHIKSADASEISHMLFSQGLKSGFTGLFATHPPLEQRIKRIDPYWRGSFTSQTSTQSSNTSSQASGFAASNTTETSSPKSAIDSIGEPTQKHLSLATKQIDALPDAVIEDAHSSFGACLLMYCLLMELATPTIEKQQLAMLKTGLNSRQYSHLISLKQKTSWITRELYLPLIDLCLPALKQLSPTQYRTFMSQLSQLIVADENVDVFEWCIFKILRYNLDDKTQRSKSGLNISSAGWACEGLLSVLAQVGHENKFEAEAAFNNSKTLVETDQVLSFRAQISNKTEILEKTTKLLKELKPLQKPQLLKAMATCISNDGKVSAEEAELLRAVGTLLDCPIPPLLNQQNFI